jgi:hypothetical protein
MGPGDVPLLPNYEFLNVPLGHSLVYKIFHDCNYLQANEGNIDPVHLSFLHRFLERRQERYAGVRGTSESHYNLVSRDIVPILDIELTDLGVRIYSVRRMGPEQFYLRVSYFVLPNLSAFPGQTGGEGYSVNWHVPIDDTHHWKYVFVFSREAPLDKSVIDRDRSELAEGYRLVRNEANRFMQDREAMKTQTFSGMGSGFQAQDAFVTGSQGDVQDRGEEHLVSSDKAIVAARKRLEQAIRDVQEGREPPHVIHKPEENRFPNLLVISDLITGTADWKTYTKNLEAEARAKL